MSRVSSVSVRPQTAAWRGLALVIALLAATIVPGGISAAPASAQAGPASISYELVTRSEGGRAIPLAQAGALRGGDAIHVAPAEGIARVRYYLDPSASDLAVSTVGGTPAAVATKTPFTFRAGDALAAQPLAGGRHTLVAAIDLVDGRTVVKTARLQVRNGAWAPLSDQGFATAALAAAPAADCAPLNCSQVKIATLYTLSFSQDHGGLVDKNGVGTGFTWVDKPTAGGQGYIPANLEVDTAASVLKITTTGGIAFLAENNQDNTLGVGIDTSRGVFVLETRLVNFPMMTGEFEQAGLWYGADDDNYLKLVVVSEPEGPRVQFMEERNGAVQQQVVSPIISLAGASVQLRMRANPATNTITGYYRLNEGPLQELSTFTVPAELFNGGGAIIDPELGTRVFGGVFATDRFLQGVAVFQFDYFSFRADADLLRLYLPIVLKAG